jgi:protein-S-isoprenylcysteine O-methyltransferase Ste14
MAHIEGTFIAFFWLIFLAVWIIAAFSAKRNTRFNSVWWISRIAILIVFIALAQGGIFAKYHSDGGLVLIAAGHPIIGAIGDALCGIGIAFAIGARFYLGRNWGIPMSVKVNPELVTTGPYASVRHPIYTGMLLAILGTTMTISLLWGIILVIAGAYFIYSATREEKLMAQTFPDTYPAYKARTKMLIPFIF